MSTPARAKSGPPLTLSIVNLDKSISQIDLPIVDAATRVLDHLPCSTPFQEDGSEDDGLGELRAKVDKSIMRFRRDQDRWTSLTSLLMKSVAFYRSVDPSFGIGILSPTATDGKVGNDDDNYDLGGQMNELEIKEKGEKKIPIMDLPRTDANRPYIPKLRRRQNQYGGGPPKMMENYTSMMNVSHQYPWVCIAQQQLLNKRVSSDSKSNHLLGLDVVIFKANLSSFSPTIQDFLAYFKQSCTSWEWERIHYFKPYPASTKSSSSWGFSGNRTILQSRKDTSCLREFFLRWAMKEAYTKALGLGLSINFDEFETRLYGVDIDNDTGFGEEDGIWSMIMKDGFVEGAQKGTAGEYQLSMIGKVSKKSKKVATSSVKSEFWEYIFIPLPDTNEKYAEDAPQPITSGEETVFNACACIARGPLDEKDAFDKTKRDVATIESLALVDLIQMHGSNPL